MNRSVIELRDASFRLGDRLVFESCSWTFRVGEQWAVVGANGSGKSLFADALRGRLPLVAGEMRYGFKPPVGMAPEECLGHVSFERRKQQLGDAVVQSRWNSLEDDAILTRDFLSYERVMEVNPFEVTDAHQRAKPQFEKRLRQAVSLLQIEPFWDRSILTLSNGENQRVQLARALCQPLKLLILDEPFAGLDAARREFFHGVLDRLMRALPVLVITTRVEDLPRHVTHLLCVDQCQVAAMGERATVLRQPRFERLLATRPLAERLPAPTVKAPRKSQGELVRLVNVGVRYGKAVILNGLNWTIRAGESWALLGPNGAGKTTLLSLIQGDHPQAYNNEVTVFGKRRGHGESIWEIKRHIGWFSPELLLHFDATTSCFDAVASGFRDSIGLYEPPTSAQRAATRRILKAYGLADYADWPIASLSGGLQRQVLLLRALVKNPRLLILDEPCQGLDRDHREQFIAVVDAIVRGGVSVIFVTHRADEIPPGIQRTLRLTPGGNHSIEVPRGDV